MRRLAGRGRARRRGAAPVRALGRRCKAAFGDRGGQALFGIQQGSTSEPLRRESSERLLEIGFDGYAIGGLAVGEGHEAMCEVLDYAPAMLPSERPRYLMGVGKPVDLVEAAARGVDMFDCVCRRARAAMARPGRAAPDHLKNAGYADDDTAPRCGDRLPGEPRLLQGLPASSCKIR